MEANNTASKQNLQGLTDAAMSNDTQNNTTDTLTVEITGANRVVGDSSIWAREDGSFFDHNGSINYKDIDHLLAERPDLATYGERPKVTKQQKMAKNASLEKVTKSAQWMKEADVSEILDNYLPFYNYKRIQSNIGAYNDNLAVFMWTPTKGGANRGRHYSSVQYRTTDPKQKWKYIKGSDSKTVECMTPYNSPVYVTFGMGDFLLLKSMGLNYMCFGGDGAAKNNPHIEYIKSNIGSKTVRVIQDNDPSGEGVVNELKDMGLKVESFKWAKNAKPKMDLRDIGHAIKKRGGSMVDLIKAITDGGRYVKQY